MMFYRRKIGEILLERGLLTPEQIEEVLSKQSNRPDRFGEICIQEGYLSEEDLAKALAEQYYLSYVDLRGFRLDESLFNEVPEELSHRYQFIPYKNQGEGLVITISDPTDVKLRDELEVFLDRPIIFTVSTEKMIKGVLKSGFTTEKALKKASEDLRLELIKETDSGEEVLSLEKLSTDTSPIVKLVDSTIYDAIHKRASDIHIETIQEGVCIKYRIDGVLYRVADNIDIQFQGPIISRIKIMSELDISEKRIPQDGRFRLRLRNRAIDFRVSILPSIFGEDAVIRILDKEYLTEEFNELRLDVLGFNQEELHRFRKMIREPYGMILVTGPTGSGKTTTLYAALSEINNGEEKIVTIEDPVEYQLKGVLQIPVNEKKGLTFARGLRSILRHDPDKIMVGEIRDPETAQIAIQSALTGHLVFTTVHANNVFDVIGRFIHMNIDPYNFVSSLNCVLAQRLVRTICPDCKAPLKVSRQLLEDSGLDYLRYKDCTFYEGKGCSRCNWTGYRGRTAITELLDLNNEIRELIASKPSYAALKKVAIEAGTVFLREAALEKVLQGITTIREINRVTFVE